MDFLGVLATGATTRDKKPASWSERLELVLDAVEQDRIQRRVSETCVQAALVRIEEFQREIKHNIDKLTVLAGSRHGQNRLSRRFSTVSEGTGQDFAHRWNSHLQGVSEGSQVRHKTSCESLKRTRTQSTLDILRKFERDSTEAKEPTRKPRRLHLVAHGYEEPLLREYSFTRADHGLMVNRVHHFVKSASFNFLCMGVVILNLLVAIGHSEFKIMAASGSRQLLQSNMFEIFEVVFMCFYVFEMAVKCWVYGLSFFRGPHASWNTFDFSLVVAGLFAQIQFLLQIEHSVQWTWLRVLRPLQLVRSLRLVNFLRFFKDFRVIVDSLATAGHSFLYAGLVVLCIMFACSLVLVEGVGNYLQQTSIDSTFRQQVVHYWGGIDVILMTLFRSISGGGTWGIPAQVLKESAGTFYFTIFILYVSLVVFAVLRVLTGICCNHVIAASTSEKDASTMCELRRLFHLIDANGSGTVTSRELREHMGDEELSRYMGDLGIRGHDVLKIFQVLDCDSDDEVDIEELVSSFGRMRGTARNIDMVLLMIEITSLHERLGLPKRSSCSARFSF